MTVRRALVAGLAATALGLSVPDDARPEPPIRIGAAVSQTGPYGPLGQNQLRGYQLCVKHANEKGGVIGRRIELLVEEHQSNAATAVAIYARLVGTASVDALLGPYSSPITDAVADVSERHKLPLVAPLAPATSIFRKGRKFVFMVQTPAEAYLEGFVEMAARRGSRTIAVIHEDTLFPRASAHGAVEVAKRRGLHVVLAEPYPKGHTDFSGLLGRIRALRPDVLAAGTYFDDAVALIRSMKNLDVNVKMVGFTVGSDLPKFYEALGKAAEFVYGASQWEPELVLLRAGGLIPIGRQYPGAREFVHAHTREFPAADLSYHTAGGYTGCQILLEAVRRAGTLDGEKVRAAILRFDFNTVYGAFKVDQDGFQVAHKMVIFQWQDGKKVIVWPEDLAPGKPRFPTPPWSERP